LLEGPRAAKLEELLEVVGLVNEVFMTPRGFPPILGEVFPLLFNVNNLDNLRIIVMDGKIISHVGIWEGSLLIYGSWFKVGMIGAVCTHKDFRGRGYASALVMDALRKMRMDGVDLVLISGDRSLYRRFGCFKSGIVYHYKVSGEKLKNSGHKFNIIPYDEGMIGDIISIYQREPVRYRRTREEFKLLLEVFKKIRRYDGFKAGIRLAAAGDKPLAYIAFSSFLSEDSLKVWEYAGLREAIPYLMANIFETEKTSSLEITVPFHDTEMLSLFERYGLDRPNMDSEASMLILNPIGFFEKSRLYLEERVGREVISKIGVEEDDGKIAVSLDGKRFMLEPSDFTLLFFDSPDPKRLREKVMPIRRFLDGALPMPTPLYGLNYV